RGAPTTPATPASATPASATRGRTTSRKTTPPAENARTTCDLATSDPYPPLLAAARDERAHIQGDRRSALPGGPTRARGAAATREPAVLDRQHVFLVAI